MKKVLAVLLIAVLAMTSFLALSCAKKEEAPEEGTTMEEAAPAPEEAAPVDTAAVEPAPTGEE